MFSLVAMGINFIAQTIQNAFFVTSLIGRIIVEAVGMVLMVVTNILSNFALFLRILYEDNVTIFIEDLPNLLFLIYDCIVNQINSIGDGLMYVNSAIYFKLSNIIDAIKWSIQSSLIIVYEVFNLIKNVFVFCGETIWFIITFIPVHLPVLLKLLLNNVVAVIIDIIVKGYNSLLKFTIFLSDVPLESFLGMMSAILVVRLCCYFREEIADLVIETYWMLIRRLNFLYYSVYNYVTDSEVRVITSISGNDEIESRIVEDLSINDDVANEADGLCVICQERQKCVLTLPCRHICLCSDCCKRLYNYQRTCPICRTFIYHSVTVYL